MDVPIVPIGVSLTIIATALSLLIWFFATLDCDLSLFYASKFGLSPGESFLPALQPESNTSLQQQEP